MLRNDIGHAQDDNNVSEKLQAPCLHIICHYVHYEKQSAHGLNRYKYASYASSARYGSKF